MATDDGGGGGGGSAKVVPLMPLMHTTDCDLQFQRPAREDQLEWN